MATLLLLTEASRTKLALSLVLLFGGGRDAVVHSTILTSLV